MSENAKLRKRLDEYKVKFSRLNKKILGKENGEKDDEDDFDFQVSHA